MYNTNFLCTYKHFENDNEVHADDLFKLQYMQAFGLETYDTPNDIKIVSETTEYLFNKMKPHLSEIITKITTTNNILSQLLVFTQPNTMLDIFSLLFIYDTFDILHKAICQVEKNGEIEKNTLDELNNIIFNI